MQNILTMICRFRLLGRSHLFATMLAFGLTMTGWTAMAGSYVPADGGRTSRTGTVRDTHDNAVGGATVVIEGTTLGVTTDLDGSFRSMPHQGTYC